MRTFCQSSHNYAEAPQNPTEFLSTPSLPRRTLAPTVPAAAVASPKFMFCLFLFTAVVANYVAQHHSINVHRSTLGFDRPSGDDIHHRQCKVNLTYSGVVGLGHALLGTYSCMLLSRLRDDVCFHRDDPRDINLAHYCPGCDLLFAGFSASWPSLKPTKETKYNNCFPELLDLCRESQNGTDVNRTCARERMRLTKEWSTVVDDMLTVGTLPQTPWAEVAIHIRQGDKSPPIPTNFGELAKLAFPNARDIHIFARERPHMESVVKQLNASNLRAKVWLHDNLPALESWLMMRSAGILVVHESSFSTSAALARTAGSTFSSKMYPMFGFFDVNKFPCRLGSWWWSSLHGSPDCQGPIQR